jgi:hypothetical protein
LLYSIEVTLNLKLQNDSGWWYGYVWEKRKEQYRRDKLQYGYLLKKQITENSSGNIRKIILLKHIFMNVSRSGSVIFVLLIIYCYLNSISCVTFILFKRFSHIYYRGVCQYSSVCWNQLDYIVPNRHFLNSKEMDVSFHKGIWRNVRLVVHAGNNMSTLKKQP